MKEIDIDQLILESRSSEKLDFDIPAGDQDRFLARLTESKEEKKEIGGKIHINRNLRMRKIPLMRMLSVPVAACLLVLLTIGIVRQVDSKAEDVDRVYLSYQAQINNLQLDILKCLPEEIREEAEGTLKDIVFEPVPILEQLPTELPAKDKVKTCKKYYDKKIEGLNQYRDKLLAKK